MGMTFSASEVAGNNYGIPISGSFQTPNMPVQNTAVTNDQYMSTGNVTPRVLGDQTSTAPVRNTAPVQTAPKPVLNRAAVDNTQKSIDELAGMLQRALDADRQRFNNAEAGFNAQEAQQRGQYDTGTVTNQQNYDSNLMASLRSGANGLSGLLSILRGTGAEGWARDAVQNTANNDIRTGLDTRNENQTGLDNSIGNFLTELAGKRRNNQEVLQNNEFAARGQNASEAQRLYKEMAGFYSDAENTDEATRFMNKAGEYTPDIARYSTAPVGTYDEKPVEVKAAPITAFGGPTRQNVAASSGDNGANAGIFTINDTRRRLAGAGA